MNDYVIVPTSDNPIEVEEVDGKEFFHREQDLHELVFYYYEATKFYPHLHPQPCYEDWEFEEEGSDLEECHRDMESIYLPVLLDDEGGELDIEQVIELYKISPRYIQQSVIYRDSMAEEGPFDWDMEGRDLEPKPDATSSTSDSDETN